MKGRRLQLSQVYIRYEELIIFSPLWDLQILREM